ncbi:hypothetical protein [Massilia sp. Root335]|jgi:hypothetical protein|uniref:hypothetical protein n=1 Tax=Massilia sp. Root335 TaxID=1736517 RepID=UPI0006FC8CBF|nr:hypothetical protein [Massilia sp. Root335]KQV51796.1 hypothetical protein ASC93_07660 [Massilia sp. Root335]
MKTLTINDLAVSCELDHKQMAHVRGGYKMGSPSYSLFPMPSYTTSVNATQNLAQVQNVLNETADGSAFVSGVTANNNTSQFGQNNLLVS